MKAIPVPFSHASAWRPGLARTARHGEIFASGSEASGAALALAFAEGQCRADERPWLWVQDRAALRLGGRPYRPGLPEALRHRLIHVAASTPEDALFALEEALRCRDLAFVVGELAGNPRALSFTASRRLSLVAEKHGAVLWLVRLDAKRDLSLGADALAGARRALAPAAVERPGPRCARLACRTVPRARSPSRRMDFAT